METGFAGSTLRFPWFRARRKGAVLACSAALAGQLGYSSAKDVTGLGLHQLLSLEGRELLPAHPSASLIEMVEATLRRRDGELLPVVLAVCAGEDGPAPAAEEFEAIVLDRSAWAAQSQELREQLQHWKNRDDLRRRMSRSAAGALTASEDLVEAAPALLARLGELLHCAAAELWLLHGPAPAITCQAAWNAPDCPPQLRDSSPAAGKELALRAFQSGHVVRLGCPDLSTSPDPGLRAGACSAQAIPLGDQARIFAVICWYWASDPPHDSASDLLTAGLMDELAPLVALFRTETALRGSEAVFRSLLAAAPDAIIICDQNGHIVLANRQTERTFGYRSEELTGQPIEVLVPERARTHHAALRAGYLRGLTVRPMGNGLELAGRRRDGSEFPAEISLSPCQSAQGLLVIAVVRDITERKQEEAARHQLHQLQLARSEQLATMGEIAAGLAHEIKNPLAGIVAALDVLSGELGVDSASREIMSEVQRQVLRIRGTLDELLNYARPRPLQLVLADLNQTIEHVVQFARQQAASRGVELVFLPGSLPPVVHDVDQIHRMLLNLVLNAIEAGSAGCRVEIESALTQDPAGEGWARIAVRDDGPGMSPDTLQRIFRPFFTTKGRSGNGLGLSLCRRIVELHQGRIDVTSAVGEGTCFVVILPGRSVVPAEPSAG